MIDICMYGCRSCNFSCDYCMGPSERQNEAFVLDEKRLKSAIDLVVKKTKNKNFFIWGGEPLLHFEEFQKTVVFLKSTFPDKRISFSTNGFLLKDDVIRSFIVKNGLHIQLSNDGIGQKFRSFINPLGDTEISIFLSKLAARGQLSINCVMHNKNCSVNKNIDYFVDWMKKYSCLNSKLNIRFTPFNESDLTPSFNFTEETTQIFLNEFETLFIRSLFPNFSDVSISHFLNFPKKLVRKSNLEKCEWKNKNACSKFISGTIDKIHHIDTKGNFVSCNLIDSGIPPRGKIEKIIPDYCNGCEFQGCRGCYPCPAGDFPKKCVWKKAWMHFQMRMLLLESFVTKKDRK